MQGTDATFIVTTDFETRKWLIILPTVSSNFLYLIGYFGSVWFVVEDGQEQVTDHDVLTSVFYPVLDNRDVISAQVSWNRIGNTSASASTYVRIMCVKSGRLENIPVSCRDTIDTVYLNSYLCYCIYHYNN